MVLWKNFPGHPSLKMLAGSCLYANNLGFFS